MSKLTEHESAALMSRCEYESVSQIYLEWDSSYKTLDHLREPIFWNLCSVYADTHGVKAAGWLPMFLSLEQKGLLRETSQRPVPGAEEWLWPKHRELLEHSVRMYLRHCHLTAALRTNQSEIRKHLHDISFYRFFMPILPRLVVNGWWTGSSYSGVFYALDFGVGRPLNSFDTEPRHSFESEEHGLVIYSIYRWLREAEDAAPKIAEAM